MMVNWFGFAARSDREGSPLAGKVAIAPIPSGDGDATVSLSVFWALAMGSGSSNKELAWEFLRFVTSPERDLGMTKHGTVGVRLNIAAGGFALTPSLPTIPAAGLLAVALMALTVAEQANTAGEDASVSGGLENSTSGVYASVLGGDGNAARSLLPLLRE